MIGRSGGPTATNDESGRATRGTLRRTKKTARLSLKKRFPPRATPPEAIGTVAAR
jgi:hypothetical protein